MHFMQCIRRKLQTHRDEAKFFFFPQSNKAEIQFESLDFVDFVKMKKIFKNYGYECTSIF